ncbi:Fucosyltransferase, N-terminal,Glycosyl transferase family 10 [Cinara cedri]|uniref:Fucosyltransferase n=1 Tax=Cinara cedri TaxID=506608 RepID=A0A5E4N2V4_9HEMI|nr:Fucosyltransferase, N-terminal,Glycosyl transferase family 10 [Cinara cedri]
MCIGIIRLQQRLRWIRRVWIMYNTEAPYSTKTVKHEDRDAFNWTANYRWDSDIPIPYGYYSKYSESPAGLKNVHVNHAEGKTKKVAMFVSNCHAHSGRLQYARELSEHIAVDIYGRCGTMTCSITDESACFDMLARDYKFYLSFENSLCHYYITEKLFRNALQNNVLPIVMGPGRADYEMVAPKNSFLHVDDFGSPKELAEYLHVLDQSPSMYNEFFQWKNNGSITTDTRFYCRLCAMLHDEQRPRKHYENFPEWWDGLGVCQKKY